MHPFALDASPQEQEKLKKALDIQRQEMLEDIRFYKYNTEHKPMEAFKKEVSKDFSEFKQHNLKEKHRAEER